MSPLDRWIRADATSDAVRRTTFRRGAGPPVIVIHELPGIIPEVIGFADQVADAGFTVVMPSLIGTPGRAVSTGYMLGSVARLCISREFTTWASGRTSPVTTWLRALAADLHRELGGPGVGAVGMCFSGGFALAMMVDETIVAPVCSQRSLPLSMFGKKRGRDLNRAPADLESVQARAEAGCPVLALGFKGDPLVGDRLSVLERTLPPEAVSVHRLPRPGKEHSVLTRDGRDAEVAATIEFLRQRLSD